MQLLFALVCAAAAIVSGEGTRDHLRGLIAAGLEASTAGRAGAGRACPDSKNEGDVDDGCSFVCQCKQENKCDPARFKCVTEQSFKEGLALIG
jgi:hypothetical protein